jgi:ribosomal protein L32
MPVAVSLNVPSLLGDLWESILRAVPKKKTSHMKKRHRQMAGKALKDVTSLNRCPACGHVKRAHILCPYCVNGEVSSAHFFKRQMLICCFVVDIKDMWKKEAKELEGTKAEA